MCVALLFTMLPSPLVTCLHESHPAWVLRPPRLCVLSLPTFARALWTPAASPLCSAAPRASLPRPKQKPLDACDRVVLGWDSAVARRAAHDPPGSRRDACSCQPLNPKPSILSPKPLNPKPSILSPKPLNPKPSILSPKPLNPKPSILSPKPLNPKPSILSPKPLNPKP